MDFVEDVFSSVNSGDIEKLKHLLNTIPAQELSKVIEHHNVKV